MLLPAPGGRLVHFAAWPEADAGEAAVAEWAFDHARPAPAWAPTPCPAPPRSTFRCRGRGPRRTRGGPARGSASAFAGPGRLAGDTLSPGGPASSAHAWSRRRSRPGWRWRPSACAARSSAPSRTTCARRSPPSPARPAPCWARLPRSIDAQRELKAGDLRGSGASQPPGRQPAGHDAPGVRGAAVAEPRLALAGGGGGSALARLEGGLRGRAVAGRRCRPTCRSCPSTACWSSSCWSTCWRMPSSTRPVARRRGDRGAG